MPWGTAVLVMAMDMPAIVEVSMSFSYKLESTAVSERRASLHWLQSLSPYSGHMRLNVFEWMFRMLSTMWESASTAVLTMSDFFAEARYLPSTRASAGKIRCGMLFFKFILWFVMMATGVASEPVPHVVGTATTGAWLSGFAGAWCRLSAAKLGFTRRSAAAFAASMAEPPPMPMMKSALNSRAVCAAFATVSVDGFSSTWSKTWYGTLFAARISVTSFREPFNLAEVCPVMMRARFPMASKSFA